MRSSISVMPASSPLVPSSKVAFGQHVQALRLVLVGQLLAEPLSCCRPSCGHAHFSHAPQERTAPANMSGVCSRARCAGDHVEHVVVAVPREPRAGATGDPSRSRYRDLRPVVGDREGLALHELLLDREDAAGAHGRDALRARLALVRGIARDDRGALRGGVVLGVVDRHVGHVRAPDLLDEEAAHDFGHAEQRREGEEDRAHRHVGAREALGVDVLRRLFVEPHELRVGPCHFSRPWS
jgi:hypothetical protein